MPIMLPSKELENINVDSDRREERKFRIECEDRALTFFSKIHKEKHNVSSKFFLTL
jgi:hypothetical protein